MASKSLTFPRYYFDIISYQSCSPLNKAYFWPYATILMISAQDPLTFLKQWFMNLVHYQFSRRVVTLLTITNTGQPVNFITDYQWYTLLSILLGLL